MGILSETVPKHVYDDLLRRYDALMDHYHALRMIGNAPVKPAVLIPPKPDSGQLAVMGAEHALQTPGARKMIEELMQTGKTEPEACRIVLAMRQVATGKALPEPAGGP
jgi:hypothetical protein